MQPFDSLPDAPDRDWIQTVTGRAFWPLSPRPQDVCILDIAHALSMKCRYTGHCRSFYSVAQHSVLASKIVPPCDALWALMHDATEAYLPDVARPVKRLLPGFREIEDRLMEVIAGVFSLQGPMPDSVKRADLILLATERRDLMSLPPYRWTSIEQVQASHETIEPWEPDRAAMEFLIRFNVLNAEPWPAGDGKGMGEQDPWHQGQQACRRGESENANPWPLGRQDHIEWWGGWKHAERVIREQCRPSGLSTPTY